MVKFFQTFIVNFNLCLINSILNKGYKMPRATSTNKKKFSDGKKITIKPSGIARIHKSVMNEIVPAIIKGAGQRYIYKYIIRFGQKHKLIKKKDSKKFLKFCIDIHHMTRRTDFFELLNVSKGVRDYAKAFSKVARSSSRKDVVTRLKKLNKKLEKPSTKNEAEDLIVNFIGELSISSALSAQRFIGSAIEQEASSNEGGIDGGEIIDSDIKGFIGGAVAGFIGGLIGGVTSAPAAAGGAAAGTLTASALQYLEEDAARDATSPAETQASGGDGDQGVWDGDDNGGSDWGDWSDGDGYGLG